MLAVSRDEDIDSPQRIGIGVFENLGPNGPFAIRIQRSNPDRDWKEEAYGDCYYRNISGSYVLGPW